VADRLARSLAADGTVLGLAAVTTGLVDEARARHGTYPTATAALGRALTGALLLAATQKRDERLSLEFRGDGPLRGILADATPAGDVRGFVMHPQTHVPPRAGKLDVGGALGRGNLCVMRVPIEGGGLYRSVVPLASGEIGEDLAHYLATSEQVASIVGLGVFVSRDGAVEGAGGYLLQALPGAADETLDALAETVETLPSPSAMVRAGLSAGDIVARLLSGHSPVAIDGHDVRFQCRCSRDRATRAVVAMGRTEIEEALALEGRIEAVCEFCATRYELGETEARGLLDE
jgi:molecular chaperone Hsp33